MFGGIIAASEPIRECEYQNAGARFVIQKPFSWDSSIGESIAVDGVCSTVINSTRDSFVVQYIPETLRVTNLISKQKNDIVNLERSLRLNDFVSGHLVTGHIDTTGRVERVDIDGDSHVLTIVHPKEFRRFLIHKGSVALNGISLTVIDPIEDRFSVAIIPHTWEQTNCRQLRVNDVVNIEYDQVAKYLLNR